MSNRNLSRGCRAEPDARHAAQVSSTAGAAFQTGSIAHRLILAADIERETFHARDTIFGGFTEPGPQPLRGGDRRWRADAKALTGDVAVRRDIFNRFKDATSVRASLLAQAGGGFSIAGSYAEGIAQPTFFDLFGFFPGNFVGNPSLKPESSRGFEAILRYRRGGWSLADRLSPAAPRRDRRQCSTFTHRSVNANRRDQPPLGRRGDIRLASRRQLRLSANYAYLKATQAGRRPDAGDEHDGRSIAVSIVIDGQRAVQLWRVDRLCRQHLDHRDTFPSIASRSVLLAG